MNSAGWRGSVIAWGVGLRREKWFEVGGAAVGHGGMRKKCDLDAEPRSEMHAVSCKVAGPVELFLWHPGFDIKTGPSTRYTLGS